MESAAPAVDGSSHESTGMNRVRLRGRVSQDAVPRELPSGSSIVSFRVVVPRSPTAMTKGSRQRSDWLDCTAWSAALRRKVSGWRAGDVVEVEGALRRRYSRAGSGLSSVELEVLGAVRVARAAPERAVKDSAGAA